jgi:hypothetical protein
VRPLREVVTSLIRGQRLAPAREQLLSGLWITLYFGFLLFLTGVGSTGVYKATRLWIAGRPRQAFIAGVGRVPPSQAGSGATFVDVEGHDYVWSWLSPDEPADVGQAITLLVDKTTGISAAFPRDQKRFSFVNIATRTVYPPALWSGPLLLLVILTWTVISGAPSFARWLADPVVNASRKVGSPLRANAWQTYAESISSVAKRSVAATLLLVTVTVLGEGVFYVQQFNTEVVGFYFTFLILAAGFLPNLEQRHFAKIARSPPFHLVQAFVAIALTVLLWSHTWKFLGDLSLSKFDTLGDLLWEFISTVFGA